MSPKLYIQIFILILSIICFSCATPDVDEGEFNKLRPEVNANANTNINVDANASTAEDNEVELNSLINLPFDPEENVYREDRSGETNSNNQESKSNDRKVTAVLKFTTEDIEKLTEQLKEKGEPFEAKIDPEPWFPAELIAKSQTSGDETIKGIGFKADMFFKPPFNSGTLTRVNDTDYFVLIVSIQ